MNKILVSDIIDLDTGKYLLDIKNEEVKINVLGKVVAYLYDIKVNNIVFDLKDNSSLEVYHFNNDLNNLVKIEIRQNNNSKMYYNGSFVNNNDCGITIDNEIKGNDNNSHISIRSISKSNLSKIIINVKVLNDTFNNVALEDLKGINDGGNVYIEPNIIALSNEVIANHLTTIGGVDKDSLNYLMSKNLSPKLSEKILLNGFKYSNMDDFIKKMGGEEVA